ncbi:MAG: 50S ribosomal protein L25/general stress protein Ctc [Candidatus Sedimenticola sp. (ex Thyasira tokunagai)]
MENAFEVEAQPRTDTGKGASRRLRQAGLVPGIVYGAHQDPEMISVVHTDLLRRLDNEAFYSRILDLKIDGKSEQVILKDLQRHPARPYVVHADFLRVSATEKLKTRVPLHFIGDDLSPGLKAGGAISRHVTDVDVSCLPADLPEFIEVDVSALEIGDNILLSGLSLPSGVELVALAQEGDHDVPVVSVHVMHTGPDEEDEAVGEADVVGEAGEVDEAPAS